jgi:hypothetical protein
MSESNGAVKLKTDDERHAFLEDWTGKRVRLAACLTSYGTNKNPDNPFLTALVTEGEITLPTSARHEIGHMWIQRAEMLKEKIMRDQRFICDAQVKRYMQHEQECYALAYPQNVRLVEQPPALVSVHADEPKIAPPTPATGDVFAVIDFVHKVGKERIEMVHDLFKELPGGWDDIAAVEKFVTDLGGWERVSTLLAMLK